MWQNNARFLSLVANKAWFEVVCCSDDSPSLLRYFFDEDKEKNRKAAVISDLGERSVTPDLCLAKSGSGTTA
jgi:hypothetical protein